MKCPFCNKPRRINNWTKKEIGTCGDFECAKKYSENARREQIKKYVPYWYELPKQRPLNRPEPTN